MGNCRKNGYCKFRHISEKMLMREVDNESENDKSNIVIMGFDPNANKDQKKFNRAEYGSNNILDKHIKIPRGWC